MTRAPRRAASALVAWSFAALAASPGPAVEAATRCGWFDNPTPGNATLIGRDAEWTVGQQGGSQASGAWPKFGASQWERTGSGGYGCACMRVRADGDSEEISAIVSSRALPLASCRRDKALKGREPAKLFR